MLKTNNYFNFLPNGSSATTGFSSSAGSPAPIRFSARTRNKYEFPWNSLEALKECSEGEIVPAVTHWPRPLVTSHFSMIYWITLDPPSVSGTSHEIVTKSLLKSTTCKFLGGPGGSVKNQKRQFIKLSQFIESLQLSTLLKLCYLLPWVCLSAIRVCESIARYMLHVILYFLHR